MDANKMFRRLVVTLERRKQVDPVTNCWLFTGAIDSTGYGRMSYQSKDVSVHVLSAHVYLGFTIGCGLYILHKPICPNRHCFNPEHLYVGTAKDNMIDRANAITHCPEGHPWTDTNIYIYKSKGGITYKYCRICRSTRRKQYATK